MLYIKSYNLLFISNPKTGTTTIQKLLLENFPNAKLNTIYSNKKRSDIKLNEHDNISKLKFKLCNEFDEYTTFVFIRCPYEKAVSSYHFYKNGVPITRNDNKRKFQVYLNIFLTKILPFGLWVLIKPIKENLKYVLDRNNKIAVNHIGTTNNIISDTKKLLRYYDFQFIAENNFKSNTSSYLKSKDYFSNKIVKFLFNLKYKKDLLLFSSLQNYKITDNLKGKSINHL
jgi:hypothetical protein